MSDVMNGQASAPPSGQNHITVVFETEGSALASFAIGEAVGPAQILMVASWLDEYARHQMRKMFVASEVDATAAVRGGTQP